MLQKQPKLIFRFNDLLFNFFALGKRSVEINYLIL